MKIKYDSAASHQKFNGASNMENLPSIESIGGVFLKKFNVYLLFVSTLVNKATISLTNKSKVSDRSGR